MRNRSLPFKFYHFNLNFIYSHFGEQTSLVLKRWIDLNYRLIRTQSKLRFLLRCKHNNIFPSHLSKFDTDKFHLHDWMAISKLNELLHISKIKILNLEIFDMNRTNLLKKIYAVIPFYFPILYQLICGTVLLNIINIHSLILTRNYLLHTAKNLFGSVTYTTTIKLRTSNL